MTTDGGAIYASGYEKLTLKKCTFTGNSAVRTGSDIYAISGKSEISDTTFTVTPNPSSVYLVDGDFEGSSITIKNSVPGNSAISSEREGGGIYAADMNSFILQSSIFESLNYAGYGGALYISMAEAIKDSTIPTSPTYSVTS